MSAWLDRFIRRMTSELIVQEYDHAPSDEELASFVDPRNSMVHQRLLDSDDEFRIVPGTLPYWFVALSLTAGADPISRTHDSARVCCCLRDCLVS